MLSQGIYQEIQFLLYSFCLGAIITFVYDNIRILRRVFFHNTFWVSLEDLVFWVGAALAIFLLQHRENEGVFRWFSIIGGFLGMLLYRKVLSNFYIKNTTILVKRMLKGMYLFFSYLFSPIYYAERMCFRFFKKLIQISRHQARKKKIQLTSYWKMFKMTLCKRKKTRLKKEKERT